MAAYSTGRRGFIGGASAFLATLGWEGCAVVPDGVETLPAWRPGELDLHFIYTGCGENMFYRLPDGTAILNDVGDHYRPNDLAEVPLLPSDKRLGGDWVARYIRRVYDGSEIDYALFSHWHDDHVGHSKFDVPDTPRSANRWRLNAKGEKVNGFLCVADEFRILRCFDHQYPKRGAYGTQGSCMKLMTAWQEREIPRGLVVEPFRVGALDQIRMQRDPDKYRGIFSIRNLCANGVIWDGADGAIDYAAEQAVLDTNAPGWIGQNNLSMGFVIRYGRFSYLTEGDMQGNMSHRLDGTSLRWDAEVGRLAGKTTVCKMSHHGCRPDMSREMLEAVRADAYVGCMWCSRQSHPDTMTRMVEAAGDGPKPLILPQILPRIHREWFEARGEKCPHPGAVHVVVRVREGGEAYTIYLLDAHDEEMRVTARFDKTCAVS